MSKFTNKQEIEYPSEEDFVDIKVLNNNTKILAEKKADLSTIENVAKERTEYIIEDKIKILENEIKSIKSSLEKGNSVIKSIQSIHGTYVHNGGEQPKKINTINKDKTIILTESICSDYSTSNGYTSAIYVGRVSAYLKDNSTIAFKKIGYGFRNIDYFVQIIEFY